jgi:glycosyltransferase involved in cell wall biosynthesis
MKPEVSVVMAVHNEERILIEEAVNSILNQTYSDFELIICDDASNKETAEFINGISKKDDRILVLTNQVNRFVGATRNMGISVAKGKYVAIMDADDFSYPDRLEIQKKFLDDHLEYAFVSSAVDCFNGREIVSNQFRVKEKPENKDFLWGAQFATPMFRKECLNKVGGYDESAITRRAEDYDLYMRIYANGFKGYNIQKPLLRYLINVNIMKNKRLYRYRIYEAIIRFRGFYKLGLMPRGFMYVIKPLLVGLIPHRLLWYLKSNIKSDGD